MTAGFAFATCKPGLEKWLREDVVRDHGLRAAFQRPGLVTFKADGALDAKFRARTPLARVSGASLGPAKTLDDVKAAIAAHAPQRVHVYLREAPRDAEHDVFTAAAPVREALGITGDDRAAVGDRVLDVVVSEGEPFFLGLHVHDRSRFPWAGGRVPIVEPSHLPSRAYRKMAEALVWADAPVRKGDVVLEFGASPGGSSLALLERGAKVVAVDPEPIDEAVRAYGSRFVHLTKAMGGVSREELPADVAWIAMDVGIAAPVALHNVRRFFPPYRRSLKGVLFTLKLNDARVHAELPSLLERVRELGLSTVRAAHLPSNRSEICVFGTV